MKRVVVFILCIFVGCEIFAQNADTIKVSPKPQLLSQEQRDSLLTNIHDDLSYISNGFYDVKKYAIRSNKSVVVIKCIVQRIFIIVLNWTQRQVELQLYR